VLRPRCRWSGRTGGFRGRSTDPRHPTGLKRPYLLFFQGTRITEAGIANLAGLKACTQISLADTAVTDAEIAAAQKIRPGTNYTRMDRSIILREP